MKKALALSLWQQTALCFLCAQMVLYIAYSQVAYCDTASYDPYSCHEVVRVFIIVAEVLSFVFTGAYCGWRRTQIRKKFGIPGDEVSDHLVWLCCPTCTLCQELRTMEAYNIENGLMRVETTEPMHQPVDQSFGGAGF